VGGRQLADLAVDGARGRHVEQAQVLVERHRVEGRLDLGVGQHRLQFRAEHQRTARDERVEQRLLAQPVTRQQELAPPCVPERQREHAAQLGEQTDAVVLPEVHEHLDVRARPEPMPRGLETLSQLDEVVDLPVEDDVNGAVLVVHGLVAGVQVDDGEPAAGQTDRAGDVEALVVGTAVGQAGGHPAKER
jgi:hypothetical protein